MKKMILILLVLFILGCSQEKSAVTGGPASEGSAAAHSVSGETAAGEAAPGDFCMDYVQGDYKITKCCIDTNTNSICDGRETVTSTKSVYVGQGPEVTDCSQASLSILVVNRVQVCFKGNSLSFTIKNFGKADISSFDVSVIGDSTVIVPVDQVLEYNQQEKKTITFDYVGQIKQAKFTPYVNGKKCDQGISVVRTVVPCS